MFEKLKKSRQTGEEPKEKKAGKELNKAPKYAVAGLGVLVMVLGAGFFAMQILGGGGGSDQQMMAQRHESPEEANRKLQSLKEQEGQKQAGESSPDWLGAKKGTSRQLARQMGSDAKKKLLKEHLADEPKGPDPGAAFVSQKSQETAQKTEADLMEEQTNKVIDKLDSIEKSMGSRIDGLFASINELKHGISLNGDKIETLTGKVQNVSGVDPEKYTKLIDRKKELEENVAELEKTAEDFRGKYKWVRHLESERSMELKQARMELEETRGKLVQLEKRPVFGEWKLAGLSGEEMLLVNPYTGEATRLQVGESFKGVTVEEIDAAGGEVRTNAGNLKLG